MGRGAGWAVEGILTAEQVRATGAYIASQQESDGSIPWFRGEHLDVWDHVDSAMGLVLTGHLAEAAAAFDWLARTQDADGSWPMRFEEGVVTEPSSDTNQCAYVAVGVWHHYLVTGDTARLMHWWPMVERALNFVVRHQLPHGGLAWAVDGERRPDTFALLTGSSSALHALECGCLAAAQLGLDRPRWRAAGRGLAHAIRQTPQVFEDRSRYSMDWYYPVLGGAVREGASEAFEAGWDRYVWRGRGVRCVDDEPWVTAAETAELIAALDAAGQRQRALEIFADIQFLRDESTGGYWTGMNVVDEKFWPEEQTTWSAGAMLLAADALAEATGGSGLYRHARGFAWDAADSEAAS